MRSTQQVCHLLIVTRRVIPSTHTISQRKILPQLRLEMRHNLGTSNALYPLVKGIDSTIGRHAILRIYFRPIYLRVAFIATAPPIFNLCRHIRRREITRQVAIVIGARSHRIVPPERRVTAQAIIATYGDIHLRIVANRCRKRSHSKRHRLLTNARISHFTLLTAPRRVIQFIARKRKGLLG